MAKNPIKYFADFEHGLSTEELANARIFYSRQKSACRRRVDADGVPISMSLTFSDWLKIWIDSGKWHLRGKTIGSYCMSRINDIGPYEIGNVFIGLHGENVRFAQSKIFGESHSQYGRTGNLQWQYKGTTVATNVVTGEQLFLNGTKEIRAAGFDQGAVSRCINKKYGKYNTYHGYKFHRIEST